MGLTNLVVNTTGSNQYGAVYVAATRERQDTYYQATNRTAYPIADANPEATQPKVVGGAVLFKGGSSSTTISNLDGLSPGVANNQFGGSRVYRGLYNGVASPVVSGSTTYAYVAACSGGFANYKTTTNLAFVAGTKVAFYPSGIGQGYTGVAPGSGLNGIYGVQTVSVRGTGNFTTDLPLTVITTGLIGTQVGMQALSATPTFATLTAGQYVIARYTDKLATASNTALRSMSNVVTRSIHKRDAFRTTKITTALRAGSYNRFLGKWTAVPTIANDASDISSMAATADHAANVTPRSATVGSGSSQTTIGPGELVYKSGRPKAFGTADGATYSAKTT